MPQQPIGWFGIFRMGLVQASLGAIVVLMTSTLNRIMVVELMLPAILPGALVALHYAVQLLRPRMGYGSDVGQRRTPWIIGGMATLATGAIAAAVATLFMGASFFLGFAIAVVAYVLIGLGVSAAGTSLLVLLAKRVIPERRAAAAAIVWMMMIAGIIVSAGLGGKSLDPYSPERLVTVTAAVAAIAFVVATIAIWGVEGHGVARAEAGETKAPFLVALAEVWREPPARHFTIFVFMSMLAYNMQDLILEPFAGAIFRFTPGQSTMLSGLQHQGVLLGMIVVAIVGSVFAKRSVGSLRAWMVGGCVASALALLGLVAGGALSGATGYAWPLKANVFLLGAANGAFSIAAIASMMAMASEGRESREGLRMGVWGAAQAIAFGTGGFVGTVLSDLARLVVASPGAAYAVVFAIEAVVFLAAAWLASRIGRVRSNDSVMVPQLAEPYVPRMEGR
jgi:MFS transporter, BCD family, chlorophyll transporter